MKDEEKKPDPQDLAGDGLGDTPGQATGAKMQGDAGEAAAAEGSADQVSQELAEAAQQILDLTNRLARAHADYENLRRRMQKEKEELVIYANQKLLMGFLPVLDNLERALSSAPVAGDEKLRQGVELTARSFRDVLAREGVTAIDAVGQPFDPNLHEAVMTVESDEHEDGTVVAEFQKGYKLGERVIRPSMVQVSKKA